MSIRIDDNESERRENPPPTKPSAWRRFVDTITYRKERAALRAELNAIEERLQAVEALLEMARQEKGDSRGSQWDVLG